jgi:non-canonical poly(A) RNA polymerase PAPD5/7
MSSYRPAYPPPRSGGYSQSSQRSQHRNDGGRRRNDGGRDYGDRRPHEQRSSIEGSGPSYDNRRRSIYSPPPPGLSYDNYRDSLHGPANGDSYRPPQGEFTFRMEKPAGIIDLSDDNYRPRMDQGARARTRDPRHRDGRGVRGGRPPIRLPAERALLQSRPLGLVEQVTAHPNIFATYKAVEEMSDDDEAEMEISDQSDSDSGKPKSKRPRNTEGLDGSEAAVPKWSNPDPYTALPCPDESQRKKKDVVKLIRKARVEDLAASNAAATTEAEDYISFDFDMSQESDEDDDLRSGDASNLAPGRGVIGAPTGPRALTSLSSSSSTGRPITTTVGVASSRSSVTIAVVPDLPPKPTTDPLGSRKRTADDELKPSNHGPLKKVNKMPVQGLIVPQWVAGPGQDAQPWVMAEVPTASDLSKLNTSVSTSKK